MSMDYSKLPDGHIVDGIALVSMKLQEAKGKVQKAVGDAKAAVKKVADL